MTTEDRTRLEALVKDACKGNASQLEEASKRDNKALLSNLTQTMNTTVSAKLDATVKREIKKLGGDLAKQTNQTIEKQLTQDSQIRAAKCDQAMKEAISKIPYSKPAMEQLGQGKIFKRFILSKLQNKIGLLDQNFLNQKYFQLWLNLSLQFCNHLSEKYLRQL